MFNEWKNKYISQGKLISTKIWPIKFLQIILQVIQELVQFVQRKRRRSRRRITVITISSPLLHHHRRRFVLVAGIIVAFQVTEKDFFNLLVIIYKCIHIESVYWMTGYQ